MAFTSTWSAISSAQTDADSPLDVTLMEGIRQNLIYLNEWVGQGYTPSTAHNHNGVNSANIIAGANSVGSSAILSTAVELSHLKLLTGNWSRVTSASTWELITINAYSHDIATRISHSVGGSTSLLNLDYGLTQAAGDSGEVHRTRATYSIEGIADVSTFQASWTYHAS